MTLVTIPIQMQERSSKSALILLKFTPLVFSFLKSYHTYLVITDNMKNITSWRSSAQTHFQCGLMLISLIVDCYLQRILDSASVQSVFWSVMGYGHLVYNHAYSTNLRIIAEKENITKPYKYSLGCTYGFSRVFVYYFYYYYLCSYLHL